MKPLVVIPARGGSKGVPRKNIKLLFGMPLIQYTIKAARDVFPDEVICVSTDDNEIKGIVEHIGLKVPFIRPKELATDQAGTYEVLLNAIDYYEKAGYCPDTLILLQPTSPFRTGNHIKEALLFFDEKCDMLVSVTESKANPYFSLCEENEYGWLKKSKEGDFVRRQDTPKVWELNGAIYIIRISELKRNSIDKIFKTIKYQMDDISSIDIDNQLDWDFAEFLIHNKKVSL